MKRKKIGLVLSGGGARGAYQVGVISAVSEILKKKDIDFHIDFFSGVSAGAINASFMAANAHDLHEGSNKLVGLWQNIQSNNVFYTDAVSLGRIGFKWMSELSFGGLTGKTTPGRALLDTTPLKKLIDDNLDYQAIEKNLKENHYSALAVTAVDYASSDSITFVQGQSDLPSWNKARKVSERADIRAEHIMASSAIPTLFPPVHVDQRWFGDGCLRNTHPCGPVIYMGAEKLFVIGVRQAASVTAGKTTTSNKPPSVARVINVLLNAVLLDGIELDVQRMARVNEFIQNVPVEHQKNLSYRPIDYFWLSPSADLGEIASRKSSKLPRVIRYLIKGLGTLDEASEIVSYLLFEPSYCGQLIELGYEDAMNRKDEIAEFFSQ